MESPAFWRDAQQRFRALHDPENELHAVMLLAGRWSVSSGRSDRESQSLEEQFRSLAAIAAGAADLEGHSALDAWLESLKAGPYFQPTQTSAKNDDGNRGSVIDGGWIDSLFLASAEHCLMFEARVSELSRLSRPAPSKELEAPQKEFKTALGRNIDRLRHECFWTYDDLAEKSGIDKKSILSHINDGTKATPRTLERYAAAFSTKLGRDIAADEFDK